VEFEVKKTLSVTKAKQVALTEPSALVNLGQYDWTNESREDLPNFVPTRIMGTPGA